MNSNTALANIDGKVLPETELSEEVTTELDKMHRDPKYQPESGFYKNFGQLKIRGEHDYNSLVNGYREIDPRLLEHVEGKAEAVALMLKDNSQIMIGRGLAEFLTDEFPVRDPIIAPLLCKQGLMMIYAPRGIGKTWLALNLAYAIATGGKFLKWEAPEPRRVAYIDGEMPAISLQQRTAEIVQADTREIGPDIANNLRIIAQEMQDPSMPDLASPEGQAIFEQVVADVDVIVVDNISTVCRASAENKADDWTIVSDWALRMRKQGKSVIFIHHAGKSGAQRGTSKREDILDVVLSLRKPLDDEHPGASFEVRFEKYRDIYGDDVKPFVASLSEGVWTIEDIEDNTYRKILALFDNENGLTQNEIAAELTIHKSTVSRHINNARELGDLPKKTRRKPNDV